jgi:hypothetical protein
MVFIETPLFTKRVKAILDDDSYAAFQRHLAAHPDAGDLIEGTGGLRKIRVAASGRGKRGGARVIYFHFVTATRIALLHIYTKNEQANLSTEEKGALKRIIERWR